MIDLKQTRAMVETQCSECGEVGLEPGFVADYGSQSPGFAKWVKGEVGEGFLGRVRLLGRIKLQIEAMRCPHCGYLKLFARPRL